MGSREINFWASVVLWGLMVPVAIAAVSYLVASAWSWLFPTDPITWGEAAFAVTVVLVLSRFWVKE